MFFCRSLNLESPHRIQYSEHGDTDSGKAIRERIAELKELVEAYREGLI